MAITKKWSALKANAAAVPCTGTGGDRRGAGLDMINEWRRDLVQTRSFDFVMGGGIE